jgi:hypothetical protein
MKFFGVVPLQVIMSLHIDDAVHLRDAIRGISTELHMISAIVDEYIKENGGVVTSPGLQVRNDRFDHRTIEDIVRKSSKRGTIKLERPPFTDSPPPQASSLNRVLVRLSWYLQIVVNIIFELVLFGLDLGLLSVLTQLIRYAHLRIESQRTHNTLVPGRSLNPFKSATVNAVPEFSFRFPTLAELGFALLVATMLRLSDNFGLQWVIRFISLAALLLVLYTQSVSRYEPVPISRTPLRASSPPPPTFGHDLQAN